MNQEYNSIILLIIYNVLLNIVIINNIFRPKLYIIKKNEIT